MRRKPSDHYLSLKYPVLLMAELEGGHTALHPDLEGCVSVDEPGREGPREAGAFSQGEALL
ncbi:type II toxin-antitoxin system HicB family antitoxin [Thermus thermophilus]|uniref:type II toxin-antitoxin system HicB family antitoxin n=1 Tax=Thermus thermophilus TaxID=274 RepID=UPI0011813F7C|nr:type II toxin-antitoxin system HicB family antitoxin [Thermus thermophilus]